jgi:hypothetical protein
MQKYYTIKGAPPNYVIAAYRGTDENNTLDIPIPDEKESFVQLQLSLDMDVSAHQSTLGFLFGSLSIANSDKDILIRISDNGILTAWLLKP